MPNTETTAPILWTPERLLEEAMAAEGRYKELLKLHPAGTVHDERNRCHQRAEAAVRCAAWMERMGLQSARWVGPFGDVENLRGARVLVKAGSRVFGTGSIPREGLITGRANWVKVHSYNQGFTSDPGIWQNRPEVRQPEITWAGSGGYWRWTDLNNVLAIEYPTLKASDSEQTIRVPAMSM